MNTVFHRSLAGVLCFYIVFVMFATTEAHLLGEVSAHSPDHCNVNINNDGGRSADCRSVSLLKYSRCQLLSLRETSRCRISDGVCDLLRRVGLVRGRRHGCRGGRRSARSKHIPVVIRPRNVFMYRRVRAEEQSTVLIRPVITRQPSTSNRRPTAHRGDSVSGSSNNKPAPSMYLLNAAALSKPHAVEQLATDLRGYDVDVAVITETHFKSKHTDSAISVPGYSVLRRDRERRRGGGVALYVRSSLPFYSWTFSGDDRTFELMWTCVDGTFIGALYHPPRSSYTTDSLLD